MMSFPLETIRHSSQLAAFALSYGRMEICDIIIAGAPVAQWIEQRPYEAQGVGSSPTRGATTTSVSIDALLYKARLT